MQNPIYETRRENDQPMVVEFSITRPDDWHLHLRNGEALHAVLPYSAVQFARALVMPNLRPPITTTLQAWEYYEKIRLHAKKIDSNFEPLMTLYLTDNTSPDEVRCAADSGFIKAFKLYPAGATTNSDQGVTTIEKVYPALEAMQEVGMVLCVHGEVTDPSVDIFDREVVFIETMLIPLRAKFPELKIVMEHITTEEGAAYVMGAGNIAATITAHHLIYNRNVIFQGGVRPHYYCLPVLKREKHRQALVAAATSSNPRFFLGTDSAPHAKGAKEAACGCAGCFTAHAAIELYAEVFEAAGALERLEGFASFHGADFYGLPRNKGLLTICRERWVIEQEYPFGDSNVVVPLRAGESMHWKLIAAKN